MLRLELRLFQDFEKNDSVKSRFDRRFENDVIAAGVGLVAEFPSDSSGRSKLADYCTTNQKEFAISVRDDIDAVPNSNTTVNEVIARCVLKDIHAVGGGEGAVNGRSDLCWTPG